MLLPLLGVLVLILRGDIDSLLGSTRSVGLTSSGLVARPLALSIYSSQKLCGALALPLRLSLRLSRMPLALRLLTAGLLARAPVNEPRRACKGSV